jgi:DNA topoisomerase-1
MKLRHVLFGIDPAFKKKKKYSGDESDLDDEWIEEHEEQLKAKEIEKAEKKFAKENEKLVEEGKTAQEKAVLRERIANIEAEFKRLAKERGTGKASLKRDRPTEKIEEGIDKLTDKVKAFKLQIDDRDAGKEVALGTRQVRHGWQILVILTIPAVRSITWILGKISSDFSRNIPSHVYFYRITAAWCKTHEVPIEKIFSKTLLTKCECLITPYLAKPLNFPIKSHGPWKWTPNGNSDYLLSRNRTLTFLFGLIAANATQY